MHHAGNLSAPLSPGASEALALIIRERRIYPRYQPIVQFRGARILAAEALICPTAGELLGNASELFAAAEQHGRLVDLELICLEAAISGAARAGVEDRLFLNLSPFALMSDVDWPGELQRLCRRYDVEPAACVLELTERFVVEDYSKVRSTLTRVRELGLDVAIDDLGAGYSGLRMWSELRPEFVKIDRYFVSGIDQEPVKGEFVRSIVAMARSVGSSVIAEGVETAEECRTIYELDVDAVQGFLFARPSVRMPPTAEILAPLANLSSLETSAVAELLAVPHPPIAPTMLIRDFVKLLQEQTHRDAFPVIDSAGAPLGMLWRSAFLLRYARPLQPEILAKQPVTVVMDPSPLLIDAHLRLEQVSQLVTRRSRTRLTDEFIVIKEGRYVGVGQTIELLERITQERVRIATHSNPLTLLPGNVPILDIMNRLLAQHRGFVVCYADLDNFKPFNDCYGYVKGDEVLLHTARVLQSAIARQTDFVGHIGGDDFIMILRSSDWMQRLERLMHEFEASIRLFYTPEHRAAGGMEATDREGGRQWFGFLSLSIALFDTDEITVTSVENISERLQAIKRLAKTLPGNCALMQRSKGFVDLLRSRDGAVLDATPGLAAAS